MAVLSLSDVVLVLRLNARVGVPDWLFVVGMDAVGMAICFSCCGIVALLVPRRFSWSIRLFLWRTQQRLQGVINVMTCG